jgi:hypothetical protein
MNDLRDTEYVRDSWGTPVNVIYSRFALIPVSVVSVATNQLFNPAIHTPQYSFLSFRENSE